MICCPHQNPKPKPHPQKLKTDGADMSGTYCHKTVIWLWSFFKVERKPVRIRKLRRMGSLKSQKQDLQSSSLCAVLKTNLNELTRGDLQHKHTHTHKNGHINKISFLVLCIACYVLCVCALYFDCFWND